MICGCFVDLCWNREDTRWRAARWAFLIKTLGSEPQWIHASCVGYIRTSMTFPLHQLQRLVSQTEGDTNPRPSRGAFADAQGAWKMLVVGLVLYGNRWTYSCWCNESWLARDRTKLGALRYSSTLVATLMWLVRRDHVAPCTSSAAAKLPIVICGTVGFLGCLFAFGCF